ncbi:AraC family ligand binding domain-containing protein [Bacillus spongiae]|uniref:AraC family ligand binding domain-containing protein n=1 Tax=Bacillus spongiae TaxID=2683610 RepID=A0ABU8H8I6_9BACI
MEFIVNIDQLDKKTKHVEKVLTFNGNKVLNLQLARGESIPVHDAPEHVMVIVRKGKVLFHVGEEQVELMSENFIYLKPLEKHSLHALEDAHILVVQIKE